MDAIEPGSPQNLIDFSKFNSRYSFLYDHFGIAFLLRVGLIVYGEFHDQVFHLNYTDVDYRVFSDAAQWVSLGKSPYERDGYRYTPILAYLVLPNMWLHPAFGKVFFAALDIVAAYLTFILLQRMKVRNAEMKFSMLLCLYNPVTINVSTRGNAESVMSVLCLLTLLLHTNLSFFLSGLVFGLSVHFKIYPVCYALPLYFWCSSGRRLGLAELLSPTPQKAKFVAGAAISFLTLTAFFYLLYGQEFLQETYFYHLTRRDTQHNFSVWFYILRIFEKSPWEAILNFLPFLIQGVFWAVFPLRFYRDLPFVCFLNTAVFVILNKVCTVQYFMWYLTFLPLITPRLAVPLPRIKFLGIAWLSSMLFWLCFAYLLEFQSWNVVILVWVASILFMAVNLMIVFSMINAYSGDAAVTQIDKAEEKADVVNTGRKKVD